METQNICNKDIEQIKRDIELIKALLMPKIDDEGELSGWAKVELERARNESEDTCTSLEDLKKEI
jgi:hypothetical protein